MPHQIPKDQKLLALTYVKQSKGRSLFQKCLDAKKKLNQQGISIGIRTLQLWSKPLPPASGENNNTSTQPARRTHLTDENINLVQRKLEDCQGQISIRQLATLLNIPYNSTWRIVRKKLKYCFSRQKLLCSGMGDVPSEQQHSTSVIHQQLIPSQYATFLKRNWTGTNLHSLTVEISTQIAFSHRRNFLKWLNRWQLPVL